MGQVVASEFTVEDVVRDDIWLKDLQHGLTVAVEATGMEYSSDIKKKINRLSEGDTIKAELQSKNPQNTIWAFSEVEVSSYKSRPTA